VANIKSKLTLTVRVVAEMMDAFGSRNARKTATIPHCEIPGKKIVIIISSENTPATATLRRRVSFIDRAAKEV